MISLDSLAKIEIDTNLLFHYTRVRPAIEHILSDGELLFNSPKHMSDPLEFENYLYMFYAHPGMSDFTFSDLQNENDQINLVLKRIFKLCCFSVDIPGPNPNYLQLLHHRGFCRSRMWSQYGDSHRGLCLVFDRSRLLHHLNFSIESIEVPIGSEVRLYQGMVAYDNRLNGLT